MSAGTEAIEVKIEGARGCGYRKKGGIYLVAPKPSAPCGRLMIPLDVCPCCHSGIKPTRSWTWIQPKPIFAVKPCSFVTAPDVAALEAQFEAAGGRGVDMADQLDEARSGKSIGLQLLHSHCPLADENLPELAGLVWVGGKFYPDAAAFMDEARRMGISRRIPAVPNDFMLGKTWVMLAHRQCIRKPKPIERWFRQEAQAAAGDDLAVAGCTWKFNTVDGNVFKFDTDTDWQPSSESIEVHESAVVSGREQVLDTKLPPAFDYQAGIFTMFLPTAVEYVCHGTETDDELNRLRERGLKPVIVMNPDAPPTAKVDDDDGDPEQQ